MVCIISKWFVFNSHRLGFNMLRPLFEAFSPTLAYPLSPHPWSASQHHRMLEDNSSSTYKRFLFKTYDVF